MRWYVIAILAFLALVFEQGLTTLLAIDGVTPSFLLILMVFLALTAPLPQVPWLAIGLGLLVDLSRYFRFPDSSEDFALIGPASLGFLAGSLVALRMRGMVFRESPLAVAMMVFLSGIVAHLVIVTLLTLRGLPLLTGERIAQWYWADELVRRFFSLLYDVVLALPLAFVLIRLQPLMGITSRGPAARRPR